MALAMAWRVPMKITISLSESKSTLASMHTQFSANKFHKLEELAEAITNHHWSPIVWQRNCRKRDNFLSCRLMVLDFDDPGYSLAQCLNDWCDTVHIIGTTKSHQKEKTDPPPVTVSVLWWYSGSCYGTCRLITIM